MKPAEISHFVERRIEMIRGLTPLGESSPVVYCADDQFRVMRADMLEAHFFELAAQLRSMNVDNVKWTLIDQAKRRDGGRRLDVLFNYMDGCTLKGTSELSYYLVRRDGTWRVELVEVVRSPIWIEAERRMRAKLTVPN